MRSGKVPCATHFPNPTKTSTTVRVDADVPPWLRWQGTGYRSRILLIFRKGGGSRKI
ncbi:MAG: BrnA antitoxin family protein [Acidiferrobacter sp.]